MMANRSAESLIDNDEEKNAKIEIGIQIITYLKTAPPLPVLEKEDKQLCAIVKEMLSHFQPLIALNFTEMSKEIANSIVKVMNDRSMKEWQLILQEFAASKKMMVI